MDGAGSTNTAVCSRCRARRPAGEIIERVSQETRTESHYTEPVMAPAWWPSGVPGVGMPQMAPMGGGWSTYSYRVHVAHHPDDTRGDIVGDHHPAYFTGRNVCTTCRDDAEQEGGDITRRAEAAERRQTELREELKAGADREPRPPQILPRLTNGQRGRLPVVAGVSLPGSWVLGQALWRDDQAMDGPLGTDPASYMWVWVAATVTSIVLYLAACALTNRAENGRRRRAYEAARQGWSREMAELRGRVEPEAQAAATAERAAREEETALFARLEEGPSLEDLLGDRYGTIERDFT